MILYSITIPGGSDTEVQYNNGGIFGADSTFTLNDTTKMVTASGLTLNGSQTYGIDLSGGTWSTGALNFDQPFDIFSNGTRCMYFNDADSIAVFGMGDAGNIDSITSGSQIFALGSKSLRSVTSGGNLIAIGVLAAPNLTSGSNCIAIGTSTLGSIAPQNTNVIGTLGMANATGSAPLRSNGMGNSVLRYTSGSDNTAMGDSGGRGVSGQSTFARASIYGSSAALGLTTAKNGIYFGYKAGINQTILDGILIIDNQDRGSAAAEITDCLIYAVMHATPASQTLRFNASVGIHSTPTIPLDVNDKSGNTLIGGSAIKLTNKTGGNTVAGELVVASFPLGADTDDAFETAGADSQETIGITLEAGVADGSEAWVVVSGIADVLMDGGGSIRGDRIISSNTAGSADVWNVGGAVATHFQEIGHCIETRVGAGLARCVLHFN